MAVSNEPQTPAETMQSLDGKSMEAVVETLRAELEKRKQCVAFKDFDPWDKPTFDHYGDHEPLRLKSNTDTYKKQMREAVIRLHERRDVGRKEIRSHYDFGKL